MATKKSDKQLWILLALTAIVIAAILLLPSCGNRAPKDAAARTEKTAAAETADETESATLVRSGDTAPDFTVEMFDGSRVTLSSLRGKVVLLNFWATWCPPCREELAHVQTDIIDRFAGRDFVFLPISRGEERSAVETFRTKMNYSFPMGLDPDRKIYDRYASNYIPRNFLIGPDGRIVAATVGYEEDEFAELVATIERTLDQAGK